MKPEQPYITRATRLLVSCKFANMRRKVRSSLQRLVACMLAFEQASLHHAAHVNRTVCWPDMWTATQKTTSIAGLMCPCFGLEAPAHQQSLPLQARMQSISNWLEFSRTVCSHYIQIIGCSQMAAVFCESTQCCRLTPARHKRAYAWTFMQSSVVWAILTACVYAICLQVIGSRSAQPNYFTMCKAW